MIPLLKLDFYLHAQGILKTIGFFTIAISGYIIARFRNISPISARWLTITLLFGSVLIGPLWISGPWYLSNIISVAFGMLALLEYSGKNRPLLIGLLIAFTWATRQTAGLALVIFFGLQMLWQWQKKRQHFSVFLASVFSMATPLLIVIIALMWFDDARFGSPFDSGYGDSFLAGDETEKRRDQNGLFSFSYYAHNIYWYFFSLPEWKNGKIFVSTAGLSVFVVSPVTIWIFRGKFGDPNFISSWTAIIVVTSILLSYYATGAATYGPRYLCDILPLWYLLLINRVKNQDINSLFKKIVIASVSINSLLFISMVSA
jgi:hypothetical protein